ncbi:translation initiation factor IF-2 [Fluviispira multicolorata]|uniref:Translation initiation factor IF-2 n=1 Tax=Fluviispira multicolorata TaxID=2654512 RepID=A0A833JDH4_9BACT|nr:translation initiation factor IF-2 [Fluviispira multicolorata]KAB8028491.1 translation initiation factor IF-2 [Fluviispira multicolorata]
MSRIRVLDLAKELGIETKAAIIKLQELGIQVKNHFNAISETEAAKLRAFHRSGKNPEKEAAQKAAANKLIIRRKVETPQDSNEEIAQKTEAVSLSRSIETQTTKKATATKPIVVKKAAPVEKALEEVTPKEKIQEVTNATQSENLSVEKIDASQPISKVSKISSENVENQSTTLENRESKAASTEAQEASAGKTADAQNAASKSFEVSASAVRSQESDEKNPVQQTTNPVNATSSTSAQIVRSAPPAATSAPRSSTSTTRTNEGGAVIVRKAEPTPPQPQVKPQSYTTASYTTQNSYRRDDNNAPRGNYPQRDAAGRTGQGGQAFSQRDPSRPPQTGGRDFQARAGGTAGGQAVGNRPQGGGFAPRDGQGQAGFRTGPGGARPQGGGTGFGGDRGGFSPRPGGAQPSGGRPPFGIPDAAPTASAKDVPSRLKDRDKDKDREKRRISDEEDARRNGLLRAKGTRRIDEVDEEFDIYAEGEGESGEQKTTVRTMIPNRRKSSSAIRKKEIKKAEIANPTKASKKIVRVDESISVNDLAGELSQKASAIIKTLMKLGMMATINQQLDIDTATFVAQEFGYEVQSSSVSIGDILSRRTDKNEEDNLLARPPIVTIMGHVDHGKTSLLDALRSANVAAKEAGGITQHIGAYQIEHKGHKLTFLDTPGHEAFTSMRARGAQVTDIVVLVVAADDGVMPQTIEAIAHAKAAEVPIIVAINKIDKPGANLERINRELSDQGVMPEEWGGDSMFIQVSAKTGQGLNDLIEGILLQAEVLDLKATKDSLAEGIVIEAKLDKARGPVATVIVTKGTLKQQDYIVVGTSMGRVRALSDDRGNKIIVADPSMPVEIIGLSEVPAAGDQFNCVVSDAIAKEAVAYRIEKQRQKELANQRGSSMEELLAMMGGAEEKAKEVSIIIKADMHGSAEAIRNSVQKLDTAKVKTKILHSAVGGITETDVILAKASNALIVGFNVRPDRVAAQVAEQAGIKIQCFSIIYELIASVQAAMVGTLSPIKLDKIIGHAEVRNTFSVPKIGVIAGSMISDGKVVRNSHVRIVRDGVVIYTGRIGSLKRFKDDAKEVAQGFECGIGVENYNDIKVGDVLEAFVVEEIAATLN